MTLLESTLLVCTAVALLWTKALDVISTWRFIGVHVESNPIARWLFGKAGLATMPAASFHTTFPQI